MAGRCSRLRNRIEVVEVQPGMSLSLVNVTVAVLDMIHFLKKSSSQGCTPPLPPAEVVLPDMMSFLPPPSELVTSKIFFLPLFPVATIYDVAKMYDCQEVDSEVMQELELSELGAKDKNISKIVWFSAGIGCDTDVILHIVNYYKKLR